MILNERLERGHDDSDATSEKCRQLVAQRLAPTRGHQDEAVMAKQGCIDGLELVGTELMQTKSLSEHLQIWKESEKTLQIEELLSQD